MRTGIRSLREGDKVRVTPERISRSGNGVLGPSAEFLITSRGLKPGEEISVKITEATGRIVGVRLSPTSLPLPEVVWDDSCEHPGLKIQATREEWTELVKHHKRSRPKKGGFLSEDLKRSRAHLKQAKNQRSQRINKSLSSLTEIFNMGELTESQLKDQSPRDSNQDIEKRNLNKLLSKRD